MTRENNNNIIAGPMSLQRPKLIWPEMNQMIARVKIGICRLWNLTKPLLQFSINIANAPSLDTVSQ